ncbi:MAG: T9SS type A sorting domain-containing protein [Saprospiraceae bacterium]
MNAQEYILGNNSVWSYMFYDNTSPLPSGATIIYKISEVATNLDGLDYFEILSFNDSYYPNHDEEGWNSLYPLSVFIRETSNQKLYVKELGNPEILIYDFQLTVGDSFIIYPFWNDDVYTVSSVDMITDEQGKERKKITFNNLPVTSWLEGIGGKKGFGYLDSKDLLCYSENDLLYYSNYPSEDCFVIFSKNEDITTTNVIISPNPVHDLLQIEMDENNFDIFIFNTLGQIVFQEKNSSKQVNISHLDKGIYFIKIEADGKKYSQKVIKN